jgi:hypothetical protein
MDERYEPITRWSNIGPFAGLLGSKLFHVGFRTPWGNLIVKPWANRLFSERYGPKPPLKIAGLCVTWVRLRRFRTSALR